MSQSIPATTYGSDSEAYHDRYDKSLVNFRDLYIILGRLYKSIYSSPCTYTDKLVLGLENLIRWEMKL